MTRDCRERIEEATGVLNATGNLGIAEKTLTAIKKERGG